METKKRRLSFRRITVLLIFAFVPMLTSCPNHDSLFLMGYQPGWLLTGSLVVGGATELLDDERAGLHAQAGIRLAAVPVGVTVDGLQSFQWRQVDGGGSRAIIGETSSTFTPTQAQTNNVIYVVFRVLYHSPALHSQRILIVP
jgi:hypothetical protein